MEALTDSAAWKALQQHYLEMNQWSMASAFSDDPGRFERFSVSAAGLLLDYSKNRIVTETCDLLFSLAKQRGLAEEIERLFRGKPVNFTEGLPAEHTALRNQATSPEAPSPLRTAERLFVQRVLSGEYTGYTGKPIQHIVNIGVGGSELGPQLVYEALKPYANSRFQYHFLANQDESHIREILDALDPETALFIVTSKSFRTPETMLNAEHVRAWFRDAGVDFESVSGQFVAVTARPDQATAWGILPQNIFTILDSVGGRYSIWSSVGLLPMIAVGLEAFDAFLSGAYEMDLHFREAPFESNMPIILALLSIWYGNFFGAQSAAVVPYSQGLRVLPDYLQQLHMESQGKTVQRDGLPVHHSTGMVLWGGIGTNSQHSFHQLFLQGNQLAPIDFILPVKGQISGELQYDLIANCFAQSRALMQGRASTAIEDELCRAGCSKEEAAKLALHKAVTGNYPSNTIIMQSLEARTLGSLLALYEHKVFVQSVLWNINAFDQWGVEYGKVLASEILEDLNQSTLPAHADSSTRGLMQWVLGKNEKD